MLTLASVCTDPQGLILGPEAEARHVLLLHPQRPHRVERRGPPRREPRGRQGDRGQEQRDRSEGGGVARADTVEEAGKGPGEPEGRDQAEHHPRPHQPQPPPQHQAQDARPLGAEGDADADLARALADGVGDDTEEADGSEDEGNGGEDRDQDGGEAGLGHRLGDVAGRGRTA